jgi:phosphoribosylglycinamide formyltransferase-1
MRNIAIFGSGSGTNAENIIRYFAKSDTIRVAVVLSNKKEAGIHARANNLGVPSFSFSLAEFREGVLILEKMAEYQVDFIVLAGFLPLVSPVIIDAFPNSIINIHPALLPKFGGKGMYGAHVHEAVVAAKETQTGISIHYVNERYDEGTVIFQAVCPVLPEDTAEDVEKKVHALEHEYFPQVIEQLLN